MIKSICFTGHRKIDNTEFLHKKLELTLRALIENGGVDFYAGGAIGWDMLCEQTVLMLRKEYPHIRLHLILPCCEAEQTKNWTDGDKAELHRILLSANSAEYVSQHYHSSCMKLRNTVLVDSAECCVCYYKFSKSGTGQTVRMAQSKGIKIINLADTIK